MVRCADQVAGNRLNGPGRRTRTAHDVVEAERLLRSRKYAETLRQRPELFKRASDALASLVERDDATLGQRLWHALLREPAETVILCMTADDPEGRLLRSNNPFSVLIGEADSGERRSTWSRARAAL